MIHAKYTRSAVLKWVWTFFASVAFGFCAIWSMHFVGMLACRLDVEIRFDILLTILSATVAVLFTFAALASPYATEAVENSAPVRALFRWNRDIYASVSTLVTGTGHHDPEAGYAPLQTTSGEDSGSATAGDREGLNTEDAVEGSSDDEDGGVQPLSQSDRPYLGLVAQGGSTSGSRTPRRLSSHRRSSRSAPEGERHGPRPPMPSRRYSILQRMFSSRAPSAPGDSTSSSSSTTSSSEGSSFMRDLSGTTLAPSSSSSWGERSQVGVSRETRLRVRARAKDRPVPEFGWRYWFKKHYQYVTVFLCVRAAIWAAAIVFMHYCGMWAMQIPQGRISWDFRVVALSYAVAFSSHFGRQMLFSTIAALGCCSMHYTGMAAATFYTSALPSPNSGYPEFLPVAIIGIAVLVCVVSNAMLAHAAITARNRMVEMILTKRRLWRIMAEKEAAEQAIELKQQFISIASHEIRTPLHTVNGYCELLARTPLTEEQSLYVTSIQQACHAINVIAGNLDRNNVELSAHPVHMEIRKMIEDLAKITEARGIQPGQPGVDIIVWIAKDVPQAVYLDETYAFRILMNLLSNAQKFCDDGYICLMAYMETPTQLVIKVIDTGCGIPKSFRSALFEPFRQADTSFTRPRQGTGLGLSIVKHLVQRMSGTVEVDTEEGVGSTFTVKVPVTLPSRSPSPTTPIGSVPPPTAKKRLRVVYRNPRTQERFVNLWAQYGYTALPGSPASSADALARGVEAIWADAETVAQSPALRSLISSAAGEGVALFIVHSDSQDLAPLDPELQEGRNVVLIKRPVIMHAVMEWMENPAEHMGRHVKPPRVRFALPGEHPLQDCAGEGHRSHEGGMFASSSAGGLPVEVEPETREKVLLVEDNMVNQRLGCRLLEKLGYDVTTANDGKQAIAAVRETYFTCCLMDCQMPVLDGFQATKQIRELEQSGELPDRLPIIALTANVTQESEGECRAAGMDHFLPKPLKMAGTSSHLFFFFVSEETKRDAGAELKTTLKRLRRPPPPTGG
ncbi:hypothetical protein C8Q78DRAFT_968724 [Trametes maxima]|nr:hypothetical protein C8Q78DRAFT_968724 [Trametes maxima]